MEVSTKSKVYSGQKHDVQGSYASRQRNGKKMGVNKTMVHIHINRFSNPDPIATLVLDASLIFGRCCCPRRFAVPVAAGDRETMQYVSTEYIDHIAGEKKPKSAADNIRFAP